MSKADCNANQLLKLQEEVERLQAEAAAMREALETISQQRENDTEDDAWVYARIFQICDSALSTDAGREMLERLQIVQAQRDCQNEQIRQLERERDELREALADIVRWPETDFDRDIILMVCQNALAADAERER